MATNKRESGLVKEKRASPSQTTKTPARGTLNQSAKPSVSSSSQRQATTSLIKPPTRSTATNASKQQGNKTASTEAPQKSAVNKTIKTASAMQKTRSPTTASTRSSSSSRGVRPVDSQKPTPGKNLKAPSKQVSNAGTVKKGSTGIKKEIESGSSATEEHVTCVLKVETPSVVEAEAEIQDQESCIGGERGEKVDDHKGADDHLVVEDQEPLDIAKRSEAETDDSDAKIVSSELSTDSGHENAIPDVKIQESNDKSADLQVLEEVDNSHEEDVREVEQVAKEEVETETDSGKETPEIKETERKEVVVMKQESAENKGPKQAERAHGKKDCALSNDVIEETASKLQEQRKNRVKALAGAFETVISLQDK